jgi:hypothetical protein
MPKLSDISSISEVSGTAFASTKFSLTSEVYETPLMPCGMIRIRQHWFKPLTVKNYCPLEKDTVKENSFCADIIFLIMESNKLYFYLTWT